WKRHHDLGNTIHLPSAPSARIPKQPHTKRRSDPCLWFGASAPVFGTSAWKPPSFSHSQNSNSRRNILPMRLQRRELIYDVFKDSDTYRFRACVICTRRLRNDQALQ